MVLTIHHFNLPPVHANELPKEKLKSWKTSQHSIYQTASLSSPGHPWGVPLQASNYDLTDPMISYKSNLSSLFCFEFGRKQKLWDDSKAEWRKLCCNKDGLNYVSFFGTFLKGSTTNLYSFLTVTWQRICERTQCHYLLIETLKHVRLFWLW